MLKEALFTIKTDLTSVEDSQLIAVARVVEDMGHHIVHSKVVAFDNTAITQVLILAESHFILHTYFPECQSIICNLFTCKEMDTLDFVKFAYAVADIFKGIVDKCVIEYRD
jgi:S-adenosylmethionine/arginine decarboxylase-like enzyme